MTNITITEDGFSSTGTKTFTVKIDGDEKGKQITKIDAIMLLWSHLDLSRDEWAALKADLQKLES